MQDSFARSLQPAPAPPFSTPSVVQTASVAPAAASAAGISPSVHVAASLSSDTGAAAAADSKSGTQLGNVILAQAAGVGPPSCALMPLALWFSAEQTYAMSLARARHAIAERNIIFLKLHFASGTRSMWVMRRKAAATCRGSELRYSRS